MWPFKKRETIELRDYLRQTKRVKVNGVIFEIKKMNLDDHLAGLNIVMKMRDIYSKPDKKPTTEESLEDVKKLKKFMRDFIYAGVTKPVLTMKEPVGEAIHIDEVLSDLDLSQKLCVEIINFSYEKKS